jgi:hypothetical protein
VGSCSFDFVAGSSFGSVVEIVAFGREVDFEEALGMEADFVGAFVGRIYALDQVLRMGKA